MAFNYEDAIKSIKALLNGAAPAAPAPAAPSAPAALSEYKLANGTIVAINKLEAGGVVTVDGQPAPDGEHQLEDGTIIKTQGGVIAEVMAPQDMGKGEAPAAPAQPNQFEAQFAEINSKFAAYEQRFAQMDAALQKSGETIAKLIEIAEQLAKVPTEDPAAPAPAQFSKAKPAPANKRSEWLAALDASLKQIKK